MDILHQKDNNFYDNNYNTLYNNPDLFIDFDTFSENFKKESSRYSLSLDMTLD